LKILSEIPITICIPCYAARKALAAVPTCSGDPPTRALQSPLCKDCRNYTQFKHIFQLWCTLFLIIIHNSRYISLNDYSITYTAIKQVQISNPLHCQNTESLFNEDTFTPLQKENNRLVGFRTCAC
jgi:hypothetical protein